MIVTETVEETTGLCGFSRCRAPLPGPGPKGGRPYAYCPERLWPGGKSCKQLAAAQDALAEALGDEPANAELALASSTFAEAADRITGPLGEVMASAEALRGALAAEVTAAAARVEEALSMASVERGLREAAEAETERAVIAETAAAERAVTDRAERDEAVAAARAAKDAATQANLAKARAEGIAATEHHRAEEALRQAAGEQKRANAEHARAEAALAAAAVDREAAASALAAATERLAERNAELEARTESLSEVTEKLATRSAELEAARNALRETERRHQSARTEARERVGSLTQERQELETRLANAVSAGDTAAKDAARTRTQLTAIRTALTTQDDTDLRTRLLSALLEPETPLA
jgi:chromosome segregation ATPase